MRRVALTLAVALAAGAAAAPAFADAPAPRDSLEGFVCQRASDSLDRAIAVLAVMRPLTGTQAMEMRFSLLRRAAGNSSFTAVPGRDLDRWLSPTPSTLGQRATDTWRLDKLVANLAAPFVYRFRVTFRWVGQAGAVGRMSLLSPVCNQPG